MRAWDKSTKLRIVEGLRAYKIRKQLNKDPLYYRYFFIPSQMKNPENFAWLSNAKNLKH